MQQYINIDSAVLSNECFKGNTNLNSVDLSGTGYYNSSMVNAFSGCYNLTSVTNIGNNVTNMTGTFAGCRNLVEPPIIPNSVTNISNTIYRCDVYGYDTTQSQYDTYVSKIYLKDEVISNMSQIAVGYTYNQNSCWGNYHVVSIINESAFTYNTGYGTNVYTATRNNSYDATNLSISPGFTTSLFQDCVNLKNCATINGSVQDANCLYYNCQSLVNGNSLPNAYYFENTFSNCRSLKTAVIPSTAKDIRMMFSNCSNLTSVSNLPEGLTGAYYTFEYCYNLITPPTIPSTLVYWSDLFTCSGINTVPAFHNNILTMYETFGWCRNITSVPAIPDSVTSMEGTFISCNNITHFTKFSNSVTTIRGCFQHCNKLQSTPEIPNTVVNMGYTFYNCTNLTGDVVIKSTNVTNATSCFYGTTLTKNVYIPFTYINGVNTATYNSFINAGYTTTGSSCGVYLIDDPVTTTVTFNIISEISSSNRIAYINNVQKDISTPIQLSVGTYTYSISSPEEGLTTGSFEVTSDDFTSGKTVNVTMVLSGSDVTINPTVDGESVSGDDITVSYKDSNENTYSFKVKSLKVPTNTDLTINDVYTSESEYYSASLTQTITESTTINLPLTAITSEDINYIYPFNQEYKFVNLNNLVDGSNFIINSDLNAITSGPSSYHVASGTSYGYIKFKSPSTESTLSVTGYVYSENNYDYGAVYIGTAEYKPTQYQIKNGTTDGNGAYILRASGAGTSSTYSYTLQPDTMYYLSFAYAKDSSADTDPDRLIITNISFTAGILVAHKVDVDGYTYTLANDTVTLNSYTGSDTNVELPDLVRS